MNNTTELNPISFYFSGLSTEELENIARTEDLTKEATKLLIAEFKNRNHIPPKSLSFSQRLLKRIKQRLILLGETIKTWVIALLGIATLFGVVNLIVWGGQKLWHYSDQKRLDEIQQVLEIERLKLDQLEATLKKLHHSLDEKETTLKQLDSTIDDLAAKNPNGLSGAEYDGYMLLIENYNKNAPLYNDSLKYYDSLHHNYLLDIGAYNSKVKEANVLANKIGTTWYVVPELSAGSQKSGKPRRSR
jgi:hypothetical protein